MEGHVAMIFVSVRDEQVQEELGQLRGCGRPSQVGLWPNEEKGHVAMI